MKYIKKTLMFLALICTVLCYTKAPAFAAAKSYTYTVSFNATGQAIFSNVYDTITVTHVDALGNVVISDSAKITLSADSGKVIVSELSYGDRITFDVKTAAVVNEGSKYYVKGVKLAGHDDAEANPSFAVTKDVNYVVSYGVATNLVAYVVNYVDENGATLLPSATYYGNVGDKPVIAFKYIDGYTPKAYNLTKVLSTNAAENVFTFEYSQNVVANTSDDSNVDDNNNGDNKTDDGNNVTDNQDNDDNDDADDNDDTDDDDDADNNDDDANNNNNGDNGGNNDGNNDGNNNGDNGNGGNDDADDNGNGGADDSNNEPGENGGNEDGGNDDGNKEPTDVIDITDPTTPLDPNAPEPGTSINAIPIICGIITLLALIAIVVLVVLLSKKRKVGVVSSDEKDNK